MQIDSEVSFRLQSNNNASVDNTEAGEKDDTEDEFPTETEEGECSTMSDLTGKENKEKQSLDEVEITGMQFQPNKERDLIVDTEPEEEAGLSEYQARTPEKRAITSGDAQEYIDKKIETSLTKVQDYFERKFKDLSRVKELEKQLEENQRQLKELKAKGNLGMLESGEDSQSEITVYKNAVERKRDSSSSEDMDTSDEFFNV